MDQGFESDSQSSASLRTGTTETSLFSRVLRSANAHSRAITVATLIVTLLAILVHIFLPRYTAKATLLVQSARNSPLQAMMGSVTGASFSSRRNEYLEKYFRYLNSQEFYLAAARLHQKQSTKSESTPAVETRSSFRIFLSKLRTFIRGLMFVKPADPSSGADELNQLAGQLGSGTSFVKVDQDNLSVRVTSRDYAEAVKRANFLSEAAVTVITARELRELEAAQNFINREQLNSQEKISELDTEIVQFRQQNKLLQADPKGTSVLKEVGELRNALEKSRVKFKQNEKLIQQMKSTVRHQEEMMTEGAGIASAELFAQLREKIQMLDHKRTLFLAQGVEEQDPKVKTLTDQIEVIAGRLREMTSTSSAQSEFQSSEKHATRKIALLREENNNLQAAIDTLDQAFASATAPLEKLPAAQQKMLSLVRRTKMELAILKEMKQKSLEIDLERVALDSKIRVLEKSTIAGIPARLNVLPKATLVLLISLILFSGLAFAADELSHTTKSRSELKELGLIIVGSVPALRPKGLFAWLSPQQDVNTASDWKSNQETPLTMAFKNIRAMILKMRSASGQPAQVLSILGATPADGKSFVSTNIAMALAQLKKKTLLLDCDLRRSALARRLKLPRNHRKGLTHILSQEESFEKCVYRNLLPNLDIISSGVNTKKATELLSSPKFSSFLDELRAKYDYIIIDTPPILPIVDGLDIATMADSVIFTVSHRKTKRHDLEQALEMLRQHATRTLFAVYNRTDGGAQYSYVYASSDSAPKNDSFNGNIRDEIAKLRKSWRSREKSGEGHAS